jgi:hypothetical protein
MISILEPMEAVCYGVKCYCENQKKYPPSRKKYSKEYYRERSRKTLYNLTDEEYKRLYDEQLGKCAICRKAANKVLSVDHCHHGGKIRGLLCTSCNVGLGMFKDDVSILTDAIYYLILNK